MSYVDPSGNLSKKVADEIISNNAQNIIDAAAFFNVDPVILASTIYAELRLNVNWVDALTDKICGFYGIDTSIGIAQIKVSTAKELEKKGYMPTVTETDGGWNVPFFGYIYGTETMARSKRLGESCTNIRYAAAYLSYIQDIWNEEYPSIYSDTGVQATLFNRGAYGENGPHSNPNNNSFGQFAEDNYDYMKKLLGF